MLGHLQTLFEAIAADPRQRVGDLPMLTKSERHQLLVEWNNTAADYPRDRCIHQLFEAQAARTPEAVAVVFEDRELTYTELNARANQLARYLTALGVGPETYWWAFCVERSLEMVVGLLGILKAGGAYVPLDPTYPSQRLAFMIEDTGAPVVVTQNILRASLSRIVTRIVCLDSDGRDDRTPEHRTDRERCGRRKLGVHDLYLGVYGPTEGNNDSASGDRESYAMAASNVSNE